MRILADVCGIQTWGVIRGDQVCATDGGYVRARRRNANTDLHRATGRRRRGAEARGRGNALTAPVARGRNEGDALQITLGEEVIINTDDALVVNPIVVGRRVAHFGPAERHIDDIDEVVLIDIGEAGED